MTTVWGPVSRWGDYRRRQRRVLEQSNHIDPEAIPAEGDLPPVPAGPLDPGTAALLRYGSAGQPLNRHSPFYIGFFGATGALLAVGLWTGLARLATTITILLVAFFLALALDPVVEKLSERWLPRPVAVTAVFGGLLLVLAAIASLVLPTVVVQGSALAARTPEYVGDLLDARWVRELDRHYDVIDRLQTELVSKLTDQSFVEGLLGGLLGAGRAVLSGTFQVLTVLVLTLYLLVSMPRVKTAAYALVPMSRRPRVVALSEEIMRRVGAYAGGQVLIATLNAVLSYVMLSIVGVPYPAVLAVTVGLLGLIPMVGATLGAAIVTLVAFFDEPQKALVVVVYYVVYQQVENYVIAPRVMQQTVSVPGTVTVVAALAGGALLGVLGALLAIPVAAGLLLLYEEVLVPRQREA
ncbi:AI-2E family transporter [Phycicoccus sp. MAQZ13P-2]|uniref:AI-2E family transporter n=1 Tax=Phycicoccus mangrovi TaxID=2840470 RepID=UPI001C0078B8|nr:AI-2E family transporter [Phycicoccus mangrovi]MBT9254191.1 AI-2E family transporter [Phycicoccus mangrovi]MBT9272569.1 AI-2E family transporter [Phycicoccus mangrovi]